MQRREVDTHGGLHQILGLARRFVNPEIVGRSVAVRRGADVPSAAACCWSMPLRQDAGRESGR
ncbi:hypothetical protein [Accumulibacter sp.]|uniref:hypothetical protein n=1 Tax=Accumulibacter sp. TaxID=2053492 RepID=UPI0015997ECA|nr:hypothetical protein [Accumulibacter sp.]QKS30542.1 MAG: hypothetical protein HT579_17445 [Candidatus Accumulibacter similis]